jgi:hypothetical protein
MGVFYLRKYPMESDLERTFGYSQYTSREKVWGMAEKIQSLKAQKIIWNDDGLSPWDLAVDGVHSRCNEPKHAVLSQDKRYFSHKFHHAAYGYELATRLHSNRLAWMNGRFPAAPSSFSTYQECFSSAPSGQEIGIRSGKKSSIQAKC